MPQQQGGGIDWGPIIAGLISAGGGYLAADRANSQAQQAAAAAGGPTSMSGGSQTVHEAHPGAFDYLEGGLAAAQAEYARAQAQRERRAGRHGGGGGGGGGGSAYTPTAYTPMDWGSIDFGGPSDTTQQLVGGMADRAMGGSDFVSQAQQALLGGLGQGGGGALGDRAFEAAAGLGQGGNAQQFIDQGFASGFNPGSDLYGGWFERMQAGGGAPPPQAPGGPLRGGPPQAGGGGGAPAAPAPQRNAPTANLAASFGSRSLEQAGLSGDPNAWRRAATTGGEMPVAPPPVPPVAQGTGEGGAAAPGGPPPPPPAPGLYAGQVDDRYRNPLLDQQLGKMIGGEYLTPESNPYLSSYLDILDERSQESADRAQANAAAQAMGGGQYGGSFYQGLAGEIGSAAEGAAQDARVGALFGVYGDERDRQLQAMGLASGRDQSRWGDLTNRYGIDKQSEAANLAAATAGASGAQNADLERERMQLQRMGLELEGIGQFGQQGQAGLGLLGGMIGNQLGAQGQGAGMMGDLALGFGGLDNQRQLGLMGMVPGLEDASWTGFQNALTGSLGADQLGTQAGQFGAGLRFQENQGMNAWNLQQQGMQQSAQQAQAARQHADALRQQAQPGQDLDAYLRRILGLSGGLGGVSGTQSSQMSNGPTPYAPQIDPWAAALQRGMGGYLAGSARPSAPPP